MNDLKTFFPNVVLSGAAVINKIPHWVKHFGGSRVLLITDPNLNKLGFVQKIEDIAAGEKIELIVWDEVTADPGLSIVKKGLEILTENGCDLVIGLGGGSVLDVSKAVAVIAENGGNIEDCLGLYRIVKRGLPKFLIPTTAGTGSEATQASVLIDERNNKKVALYSEYNMADAVFIDFELTYDLPPVITADTGIDALCHAIEAFVSRNSSDFTDMLALSSIKKAGKYLIRAYRNGKSDREAREGMANAAFYAGMSFCGAGLGGAHGLAYPLDTDYHLSHGRSAGVFLPWVMEYNLPYIEEKFSMIAAALDESCNFLPIKESALKSIDIVKDILRNLSISYKLSDYGVREDKLSSMAESAVRNTKRLLKSNPRPITINDAKEIYKRAY